MITQKVTEFNLKYTGEMYGRAIIGTFERTEEGRRPAFGLFDAIQAKKQFILLVSEDGKEATACVDDTFETFQLIHSD